ncbi:NUDIX hydrolase [Streptomyces sp. NPDC087294]|uniref:NUDIX hydrolase n=1 Tax=Streptomyces sp. NPDC087294 TaxID=3365777 RepID=UPI003825DA6D
MPVEVAHVVSQLTQYLHKHPGERMSALPLYDAARDHSQRRACTHGEQCPVVVAGPIVLNEVGHVLAFAHDSRRILFENEPAEEDSALSDTALRVLKATVGTRDVWTEPGSEGPFLVDVTPSGQTPFGPRVRVGFRYLFRAHSDLIGAGPWGWADPRQIGIHAVRQRLLSHPTCVL